MPLAPTVRPPPCRLMLPVAVRSPPLVMVNRVLLLVCSCRLLPPVGAWYSPAFCTKGVFTLVVSEGLLIVLSELQEPPVPKVMALPPPPRLPVPLGQVSDVLPWTAVLALEP